MMDNFTKRLRDAAKRTELTVSDLAVWFCRPQPTVWQWHVNSVVPKQGPIRRGAARDLDRLEKAIAVGSLFPVPSHISERLRADYVRNAYHAAERARVPKAGVA